MQYALPCSSRTACEVYHVLERNSGKRGQHSADHRWGCAGVCSRIPLNNQQRSQQGFRGGSRNRRLVSGFTDRYHKRVIARQCLQTYDPCDVLRWPRLANVNAIGMPPTAQTGPYLNVLLSNHLWFCEHISLQFAFSTEPQKSFRPRATACPCW